jgi:zinc transport system ATP-binding protein
MRDDNRVAARRRMGWDDMNRGATAHVLEVERLSVRFGEAEILHDVSFALAPGSSLAVIGPNGAGKTVLFRALIGAIPHGGHVRWSTGTRIGYVPQKLDLERDLPLTGNDFLRAKTSIVHAADADVRVVLELVGVGQEVASQRIGTLSGGQFQRLLLAFALLGSPNVLLFDEPTAGVDEPGQEQLYETIHRLQERRHLALLLISHELSVVYRYAGTVLCLGRGRAFLGPPTEILTPERIREVYGAEVRFHRHGD